MTKGIATSGNVKQRKREDHMKTPKIEMELIGEEQRVGKRSYGKESRKKFPFSSGEIASLAICKQKRSSPRVVGKKLRQRQSRLRVELMKTELAKMKVQVKDSAESLMAANIEANQAEAKLELLVTTRNEQMDNLLEMKATEAFLMGFL